MKTNKGFLPILAVIAVAVVAVVSSAFYVRYEVNKIEQANIQANLEARLGATVYITQLTDTINTLRLQVNSSTANLNTQLTTGIESGFISGTIAIAKGGTNLTTSSIRYTTLVSTGSGWETTSTLPVNSGGTGQAILTANNLLVGNGTSAIGFIAPGTSGNQLLSTGTSWESSSTISAVKTVYIFGEECFKGGGTTASGTTNDAYIVYADTNNDNAIGCWVRFPQGTSNVSSTKMFYKRESTGNLQIQTYTSLLKLGELATSTYQDNTANTQFITPASSDGKIDFFNVTSTAWDGLPTASSSDLFFIQVVRSSAEGTDTYNKAWKTYGIEITFK